MPAKVITEFAAYIRATKGMRPKENKVPSLVLHKPAWPHQIQILAGKLTVMHGTDRTPSQYLLSWESSLYPFTAFSLGKLLSSAWMLAIHHCI